MTGKPFQWCLSNRVSLTLAAVVAANIAGAAWWSSGLSAQVVTNKDNVATNTRHVEGLGAGQREIGEALAGLSVQMDFLLVQYGQLAQRLDAGAAGYGGER